MNYRKYKVNEIKFSQKLSIYKKFKKLNINFYL